MYQPSLKLIQNVTNSVNCTVTTTTDHGYATGYIVRVDVPPAYGMQVNQTTSIIVIDNVTFSTQIDTSNLYPFTAPNFVVNGQGFTQAQVIPISGTEMNVL